MHLNLCFKSPQIIQPSNIFTKLGTLGFRVYRVIIRSKCHRLKTLLKKKVGCNILLFLLSFLLYLCHLYLLFLYKHKGLRLLNYLHNKLVKKGVKLRRRS